MSHRRTRNAYKTVIKEIRTKKFDIKFSTESIISARVRGLINAFKRLEISREVELLSYSLIVEV